MADVLHLTGPVLLGPDDVRAEAWVVGGQMTYAAPHGAHDVTRLDGWVLPGLVDAHSHIGLDRTGATDEATAEAQAVADRDAGTLLIRDAGSPADTRWIQEREDLPRLVRAGRHIARTRRYIRGYAWEVEPEDLVAQVRLEARSGDGWVKVVGDWIDRDTGDLEPCWPTSVLRDAVAAAHEEGARITAHCFGEASLVGMHEAGFDCVEHASGLTDETIGRFAAQRIAIVPTLVNIDTFPAIAEPAREKYPAYHRRMMSLHERRYDTIGKARDAGIPIYLGTDAGGSLAHGLVAEEAVRLGRAGLSTREVLQAACWAARPWLGLPGLEESAAADLVVLPGDPRADIRVLAAPSAVVLRGRRVGPNLPGHRS